MKILCHILPQCIYDIILGTEFLADTETMSSKHRSRITKCLFNLPNIFRVGSLGEANQYLKGELDNGKSLPWRVLAVMDTGAECNLISKRYNIDVPLHILNNLISESHEDAC